MTNAIVWLDNSKVKRVKVSGHSEYAKKGSDIVCSSISTAMILSANLVTKLCEKCRIDYDEKKTSIDIEILESNDVIDVIMKNLYETLIDISTQYSKYFQIKVENI